MLRRPLALCLAAAALGLTAGPAAAQPAPDYTWNNFVGTGTTWAGANNWLLGSNGVATTITPATSVNIAPTVNDRVFWFGGSPLQTAAGYTTTNSSGTVPLNSMVFNAFTNPVGAVTVTNTLATDTIQFNTGSTGAALQPSIWQTGTGRVTFRHAVAGSAGITLNNATTLNLLGAGIGDLYLDTSIAQSGAGNSGLAVNLTGTRPFGTGATVRLGGSASAFAGGVTLTSGNLLLSNVLGTTGVFNPTVGAAAYTTPVTALGTGTLTIAGGTVQFDPTAATSASPQTGTFGVSNAVQLNSTLTLTGVNTGVTVGNYVANFSGPMGGAGGLTLAPLNGTMNYALTGANSFTGAVSIAPVGNAVSTLSVGTNQSAGGTLSGASQITVGANSLLLLNDSAGVASRLNPTPPALTLNRSSVTLYGNQTADSSQTFGAVTLNGLGVISAYPFISLTSPFPNSQTATLTLGSLTRNANATVQFLAPSLNAGTATEGRIVVTANPGGAVGGGGGAGTTTRSILPYAFADTAGSGTNTTATNGFNFSTNYIISGGTTGVTNNLVRYDSTTGAIVPLSRATGEYATNLYTAGATAPTANYLFASTFATPNAFSQAGLNFPTAANAVVLETNLGVQTAFTNRIGTSLSGTGTLTVGGGAVVVTSTGNGSPTYVGPSLINTGGLAFGGASGYVHTAYPAIINAPVTGTAGLVKSGTSSLVLNGTNTFTGGLFSNAGTINFTSDANLGAAGQPIALNGGLTGGLLYLPQYLFNPVPLNGVAPNSNVGVTVNRPISIGAPGANVNVSLANTSLTLPTNLTGTGQIQKAGNGVLALTGNNSGWTGNLSLFAGTVQANSDAALGGGSLLFSGGGTLQPTSSFSTNRTVMLTSNGSSPTIFTNGNNLTVNGNIGSVTITATSTILKDGPGDLILTAANTFAGNFQTGGSGPTVRGLNAVATTTAGRTVLSGADGSLALAANTWQLGDGELVLDNTAVVNNNRVSSNGSLGLNGGKVTLLGNAGASVNELVGTISTGVTGNAPFGGVITLAQPTSAGGQSTTLTGLALSGNATIGTVFVRGTNLGATTGDRAVFTISATAAPGGGVNGVLPGLVAAAPTAGNEATAVPTDFVTAFQQPANGSPNATSLQFNLVPFGTAGTGTSYTAQGAGAFAPTALNTYDVTGGVALMSAAGTATALRLSGGGGVDTAGNVLTLNAGHVLATGANAGIANGTLTFASALPARFTVNAGADLTVSAAVTGTGGLVKSGAGVLTLSNATNSLTTALTTAVAGGTLRYGVDNAVPTTHTAFVATGATLDLNGRNATLAAIVGYGNTTVGSGNTLTITTSTAPAIAYGGSLTGSGALVKDATNTNTWTLSGDNSGFSGPVTLRNGGLATNTNTGLGTGAITLGDTTGANTATLTLGATVTQFGNPITVASGTTSTTPYTLTAPTGVSTISSNILVNNTAGTYTVVSPSVTGLGLRLSGGSGPAGGGTTLSGVISGAGGVYVFGGNWAFANTNTYTGPTLIDTTPVNTIGVGSDQAFGTGSITFSSQFGANLRADGGARVVPNNLIFDSTAATTANNLSQGGYFGTSGTNPLTFGGNVSLSGVTFNQTFNVMNTAPTTFGGVISNTAAGGVNKIGPGEMVLTGASTYTGPTVVNAGTLRLGNGGTAGSIDPTGNVTVGTGAILAFNRSNALGFANTVDGGGVVVQAGAGTTTLTANNTYTGGTTVTAGTLLANGQTGTNSGTGTGPVTVSGTGTLGGNGRVAGAITVNTGGTLAPGIPGATPGTLTAGAAPTLTAGSALRLVIASGTTPATAVSNSGGSGAQGVGSSLLDAGANTITLSSPNVVVDVTGVTLTPFGTYSFVVARGTGVTPAGPGVTQVNVPQFTFVSGGADVTGQFAAASSTLFIDGGAANNVYLNFSPVPEPATVLGVAGLGLAAVRLVRRRRAG